MMVSISLGYNEHVIAIFKSLVEEYSVFFAVDSAETKEELDKIKRAYWVSSRMQIDAHFEQMGLKKDWLKKKILRTYTITSSKKDMA